jgi:BASS family bile acid:Na+ symporter
MRNYPWTKIMRQTAKWAAKYFTLWVLLASLIAIWHPPTFAFVLPHIRLCLGIIMFGMGMTLQVEDFKRVLLRPRPILLGVAAQYTIMPLLALSIAWALGLPPELAAGIILLGCCPGGTASNVICYLAGADVALSVSITSLSTLIAPLLTPLLTLCLAGQYLPVQAWELFQSIAVIVLTPVTLGLLTRHFLEDVVRRCLDILPIISVITIVLLVGAIVGKSSEQLLTMGLAVILAVFLHNGFGLFLGYGTGILAGADVGQRRAMSIEVGMQNSGLALALASLHFSPLAALPAAFFSVWHNMSGPLLASIWSRSAASSKQHSC